MAALPKVVVSRLFPHNFFKRVENLNYNKMQNEIVGQHIEINEVNEINNNI